MKKILYFLLTYLALTSCASTQNTVNSEAKKRVDRLKPILELTDIQAKKIYEIEKNYLWQETKIRNSVNYNKLLQELKMARYTAIEKILDRIQLLKFDAFEKEKIKDVRLRV